jgi:hypothetical protein
MKRTLATLLLAAASITAHSQTAPALQYVPMVSTYAGGATTSTLCTGATDTLGDGCLATQSILSVPTTGEADAAGNLYFADEGNNVVRRIDVNTGIITVVAGQPYTSGGTVPSVCAAATDAAGDGCLATQATFNGPRCVRFDRAGNMVIADVTNQVIRRIDHTTGIITVLLGEFGKDAHVAPKNASPLTPLTTELYNPYIFIFDPAGNMIVSNSTGDSILFAAAVNGIIDPVNSKVYDLAGTSAASTSGTTDGNGGLAINATFATPRGLALDAAENVYIGDYNDEQVRRVTSPGANGQFTVANLNAGIVTDLVGTGTLGTTGNGGLGTFAETSDPQGLGFDNAGTLYIEQYTSGDDFIRTLNISTDIINAFAGTGAASESGDNGPAATATFFTPTALKANLGGRLTIFDSSNSRIRNIYPTPFFSPTAVGASSAHNAIAQANVAVTPSTATLSNTTEFALGTPSGCTLGTSLAANAYCALPLTFTPSGPGLRGAQLRVTDANGNIYLDPVAGIGLAPAAGFYGAPITTIAGNGNAGSSGNGATASAALINAPQGGTFDALGNFFFADTGNNAVREIVKSTGNILLVAGTGNAGFSGDGAPATSAQLNAPRGVAVDPAGNVYIADTGNNRIRQVSASTGTISTIAGTGTASYTGDNASASAATLNGPTGLALDNTGVLYVADTGNNALRAFSVNNGVIVTLAGTGTAGYAGDGGVPQLAQLSAPTAVTVDLAGNIYIADTGNAIIRKLTPINAGIINFQATIATFAGIAGGTANTGDGGPATSANLLKPSGVATDAAGDVYIAAGGQVRLVPPSGTITTIGGTGASGSYSGEGGSATGAVIPSPAGAIAVDPVGNVYLSATAANRILSITGSSAAAIAFGSQTINTTSSPQTITLYNPGNQPLTLSSISVPTAYALSSSLSTGCSATTTLAPGASCTLTLTFTPPSVANYAASLTLTDNALNTATSTQIIPLTGTGVGHLNTTTTTLAISPTAPVYGQTVTLTATVSATTTPTGKVNFVVNNGSTISATLNASGQASIQLTPAAGSVSVTVNYLGDTVNAGSYATTTFTVAPAVLTVTAGNQSIYPTQAVPTLTYTIAGFVNSDTAAKVVTGTPTLSTTATSSSPSGSYPITVAVGSLAAANYTFTLVNGTLTIQNPTFTLAVSPTSLNIPSGSAGSTTVTVTPSPGYTGKVALSCGSVPADVVCTFTATSLAVDPSGPQSTLLTVATNNHSEIAGLGAGLLGTALSLLALAAFSRKRRRLSGIWAMLLLAAAMTALSGCAPASQNASAYSGTLTITATDTTAKITQTVTIALTIH